MQRHMDPMRTPLHSDGARHTNYKAMGITVAIVAIISVLAIGLVTIGGHIPKATQTSLYSTIAAPMRVNLPTSTGIRMDTSRQPRDGTTRQPRVSTSASQKTAPLSNGLPAEAMVTKEYGSPSHAIDTKIVGIQASRTYVQHAHEHEPADNLAQDMVGKGRALFAVSGAVFLTLVAVIGYHIRTRLGATNQSIRLLGNPASGDVETGPEGLYSRNMAWAMFATTLSTSSRVLVIGGSGRVGGSAARALIQAGKGRFEKVSIGGRSIDSFRDWQERNPGLDADFLPMDIYSDNLEEVLGGYDLIVNTAGPFQGLTENPVMLKCMEMGKQYLDVCDDINLARNCRNAKAQALASESGGSAVISVGIWPGASSLLAKATINQAGGPTNVKDVRFSFYTAGSGGAGKTILTATFLLLGEDVLVYKNGEKVYRPTSTDPISIDFGTKIGSREVSRLNLIECESCASHLVESGALPAHVNVETRFGTAPGVWNTLFGWMVKLVPQKVLQDKKAMDWLAVVSLPVVRLVDVFVGSRNGIRVDVTTLDGSTWTGILTHDDMEKAVGDAICAFAVESLAMKVPAGVWFPEEVPSDGSYENAILKYVAQDAITFSITQRAGSVTSGSRARSSATAESPPVVLRSSEASAAAVSPSVSSGAGIDDTQNESKSSGSLATRRSLPKVDRRIAIMATAKLATPGAPPAAARPADGSQQLWYDERFAMMMRDGMRDYERRIVPVKQELFQMADLKNKDVVEIGLGSGPSIPFYSTLSVRSLVGVDPNLAMHAVARETAKECRFGEERLKIIPGFAENLPLADSSADVVVCSMLLCSVSDVQRSVAEIKRVLKPGGRYVFLEHIAAPRSSLLRGMQTVFDPLQHVVADGCHLHRDPLRDIRTVGWAKLDAQYFSLGQTLAEAAAAPDERDHGWRLSDGLPAAHFLLSPHLCGIAYKEA